MNGHIRQRGKASWELHYRHGGRTRTTTVRGTKRDAQQRLRALLHAVDRGEHVNPTQLTVAEFVEQRIEAWRAGGRISSRTLESYRTSAKLIAPIGDIAVQKLGTDDVERWHLGLRHLSTSAKRAAHGVLQRALRDAVRHKICAHNAAVDQGPPPGGKPAKIEMIGAEQITTLLKRLDSDEWRVPVVVALYCGLRRGEQRGVALESGRSRRGQDGNRRSA